MNRNWIFLSLLLILFLSSCGASKKAKAFASNKSKLESQYELYAGTPYKYGGTDKRGFDCSGFTQKVYSNAFNVQLPRTTKAIGLLGKKVSKSSLKPGDLVFFRPSRKYRHMGIYVGNNRFIHSGSSTGVTKSDLNNPYWKKKYRFARRILKVK